MPIYNFVINDLKLWENKSFHKQVVRALTGYTLDDIDENGSKIIKLLCTVLLALWKLSLDFYEDNANVLKEPAQKFLSQQPGEHMEEQLKQYIENCSSLSR